MSNLDNIKNGKQWSDAEKIRLYKLVIVRGRCWAEFAKEFGVSPKACADCHRRTNWDSFLKKQGTSELEATKQAIQEIEPKVNVGDHVIDIVEEAKIKILEKEKTKVHKELAQKAAVTDLILEKIETSIAKIPKVEIPKIKYPKATASKTEEEACLILSDLHVGLACVPEEVGGLGHYNLDIFRYRLKNLINSVSKIADIHRKAYKLDTLNIFGIGDFVHGSNDAGQWGMLHTEQNIMDQIFGTLSDLSEALLTLNQVFPKIKFYGVYGNHGRVAKRGVEKAFVNWDYILYKMLESNLSNNKNIEFFVPRATFQVAQILNDKFLLIHGDQVRMWNGIPFYGLLRAEGKYRNMLSRDKDIEGLLDLAKIEGIELKDPKKMIEYSLNYAKAFDYMVMGHFHQPAELESSGGGKIIMNNSFIGGDDYTINDLLLAGSASQKFFGMHPEGRSWTYDIDLDRT